MTVSSFAFSLILWVSMKSFLSVETSGACIEVHPASIENKVRLGRRYVFIVPGLLAHVKWRMMSGLVTAQLVIVLGIQRLHLQGGRQQPPHKEPLHGSNFLFTDKIGHFDRSPVYLTIVQMSTSSHPFRKITSSSLPSRLSKHGFSEQVRSEWHTYEKPSTCSYENHEVWRHIRR